LAPADVLIYQPYPRFLLLNPRPTGSGTLSFQHKPDNWRACQVRNAGVVEGNPPVSDNAWETITRGGDTAIQRWINDQLNGKSCAVVLIGSATASRKWIKYEIEKVHARQVVASDLYAVAPRGSVFKTFAISLLSFSIWPFYVTLSAMMWLAKSLVIP
jgi:hypothetical protein